MLLALLAAQAAAAQAAGTTKPDVRAPSQIVAAAPASDWRAIPADDLIVMDLAPDAKGRARRVVIQLLPAPFSQGWIGNIRKLAAAHWWDGTSINRVQDNYVAQWGDPNGDDKAKAKRLPKNLARPAERDYVARSRNVMVVDGQASGIMQTPSLDLARGGDAYAERVGFYRGFPIGGSRSPAGLLWPIHCYGMVGVGRDMPPNTGTGAELYTVIGQAPRHLDRNIALVGRVIDGIENLSSLPRGTGDLGFYKTAAERTPIVRLRLATELRPAEQPRFEYLSTESTSFAAYADARANRRDAFFIQPAGGADICNVPVPVRRVSAG